MALCRQQWESELYSSNNSMCLFFFSCQFDMGDVLIGGKTTGNANQNHARALEPHFLT